jgi:hypothetical protein
MKNSKQYAIALIVGLAGMVVTMLIHPSGPDIHSAGEGSLHAIQVNIFTHSLAIASIPVSFFGFLGLSRILGIEQPRIQAALISYGFSGIAGMCAAVCSGFGASGLAKQIITNESESSRQILDMMLHYNGYMNQGFAKVMVVASSIAVVLWSLSFLKMSGFARIIGILGILIGMVSLAAFFVGFLKLDVYGFGLFIFAQSLWIALISWWLISSKDKEITQH